MVSLDNPAVFDKPTGADRATVEAAARRLYSDLTVKSSATSAYALGLAYLNPGHIEEGIATLRSVAPARTADSRVAVAVERLATYRASRVTVPAARPPVVVVDDSPTVRKLLTATLTAAGSQVIESADGYEAAERVRLCGPPKLFILDVNMPGMDGFELCKLFRNSAETAKVPVVFLTGKDGFFNKLRGQWAGAAEYVTKPFAPDRLVRAVAKLVPVGAASRVLSGDVPKNQESDKFCEGEAGGGRVHDQAILRGRSPVGRCQTLLTTCRPPVERPMPAGDTPDFLDGLDEPSAALPPDLPDIPTSCPRSRTRSI